MLQTVADMNRSNRKVETFCSFHAQENLEEPIAPPLLK